MILLDVKMPKIDGFEVCRRVKENERTRLIPIIMITVLTEMEDKIKAIEAGVDDFISQPFNKLEILARTRSLLKLKQLTDELDNAENVIFALARTIEAKDKYTEGHTERVAEHALALGKRLNLSKKEIDALKKGSILHDIGKIGVPDIILNKPAKLEENEFEIIKKHPDLGEKICKPLKSIREALPIIRWHHEKLDGSGYPDGIKGDEIPAVARIMAIVDVYDALKTERPYKKAFPKEKCLNILTDEARKGWWDEKFIEEFSHLLGDTD